MAKIENRIINSNVQPKGTLTKSMLKKHKLIGNVETTNYSNCRDRTVVARSVRAIKTYRQFVHNVNENKLAASLKQTAHYFLTPLTRADSDNPKDRRGLEPIASVETGAVV